jgi:hypothetical protein
MQANFRWDNAERDCDEALKQQPYNAKVWSCGPKLMSGVVEERNCEDASREIEGSKARWDSANDTS